MFCAFILSSQIYGENYKEIRDFVIAFYYYWTLFVAMSVAVCFLFPITLSSMVRQVTDIYQWKRRPYHSAWTQDLKRRFHFWSYLSILFLKHLLSFLLSYFAASF